MTTSTIAIASFFATIRSETPNTFPNTQDGDREYGELITDKANKVLGYNLLDYTGVDEMVCDNDTPDQDRHEFIEEGVRVLNNLGFETREFQGHQLYKRSQAATRFLLATHPMVNSRLAMTRAGFSNK